MRLDLAVARRFGLSRRAARDAVRAGRIDVGGTTRDEPGLEVPEGTDLAYDPNRRQRRQVRSRLAVLVEDPHILIVDKPAGLLSVATAEHEKDTLVARALAYLQHRYRRRAWVGVVHRLDKDTSGAIVFARSREALRFLQERFRDHDIEREYVALVEGDLRAAGVFEAALVLDRGNRRRGIARPGESGRRAVTRYQPIERFRRATLVSVHLETGRTHQIRVHFGAAGHPVVGDEVYRPRDAPPPPIDVPRQMLHARVLGFEHPKTGEPVKAVAPLPEDFATVVADLRRRRGAQVQGPSPGRRGLPSPHLKKRPEKTRGVRRPLKSRGDRF